MLQSIVQNTVASADRSSLACQSAGFTSPDPMEQRALEFAAADYRWRMLRADPQQWTVPEKQRTLAVAFLNYHAAKLALTVEDVD